MSRVYNFHISLIHPLKATSYGISQPSLVIKVRFSLVRVTRSWSLGVIEVCFGLVRVTKSVLLEVIEVMFNLVRVTRSCLLWSRVDLIEVRQVGLP